jgi:hypothetical protein
VSRTGGLYNTSNCQQPLQFWANTSGWSVSLPPSTHCTHNRLISQTDTPVHFAPHTRAHLRCRAMGSTPPSQPSTSAGNKRRAEDDVEKGHDPRVEQRSTGDEEESRSAGPKRKDGPKRASQACLRVRPPLLSPASIHVSPKPRILEPAPEKLPPLSAPLTVFVVQKIKASLSRRMAVQALLRVGCRLRFWETCSRTSRVWTCRRGGGL